MTEINYNITINDEDFKRRLAGVQQAIMVNSGKIIEF